MRGLRIFLFAFVLLVGCERGGKAPDVDAGKAGLDRHEAMITKFQDGQDRFKSLVAGIRDEGSFDVAAPELDRVLADWREVARTLQELDPPSTNEQAGLREMISDGNRATEPTGEDMLGLISIQSREKEITAWLEDFAEAGRQVGGEMSRLYGPVRD